MRNLIAVLLIVPFLQGCNQQPPTGRFQIVAGTYEETDFNASTGDSSGVHHEIFKIDTETGKTWIYLAGASTTTNGVSTVIGWIEIKDLPPLK
jgi:hypothetical protein